MWPGFLLEFPLSARVMQQDRPGRTGSGLWIGSRRFSFGDAMPFILVMLALGLVAGLLSGYALYGLVERAGSLVSNGTASGTVTLIKLSVATALVLGTAFVFSRVLTAISGSPEGPSVLGVAVAGHIFSCALALWFVALRNRGDGGSQETADR
jgi:hypothetical protein